MIKMRVSARSAVRQKLKRLHNVYFDKKNFYKAVCSYNDYMGKIGDFSDMVEILNRNNAELKNFTDYLLSEYEPIIK